MRINDAKRIIYDALGNRSSNHSSFHRQDSMDSFELMQNPELFTYMHMGVLSLLNKNGTRELNIPPMEAAGINRWLRCVSGSNA